MARLSRFRLQHLEDRLRPHGPPRGRLLFLIPDLWPEVDQALFRTACSQEELSELIERRTGVRPTFGMHPVWSITVPVPDEMLALSDEEKAAFLAQHESRPRQPDVWE